MHRGLQLTVVTLLLAPGCTRDAPTLDVGFVRTQQAPLFVTTVQPMPNATGVTKDTAIQVNFDQRVERGTVYIDTLPVFGGFSGLKYAGYMTATDDTYTIALDAAPLPGERIGLIATSGIRQQSPPSPLSPPFFWEYIAASGAAPANFSSGPATFANTNELSLSLAIADLDGDERLDVIVGRQGQDYYYSGISGGPFSTPTPIGPSSGDTLAVAVGDFNRDGAIDVVTAGNLTGIRVFLNGGSGSFDGADEVTLALASRVSDLAVGDLNNDGWPDLVAAVYSNTESTRAFINDGTGGLSATGVVLTTPAYTRGVALADIKNDGWLDVILANYQGQDAWIENTAGAGWSTTLGTIGGETTASTDVAVGDVTGDGYVDVVIGLDGSPPHFYRGSSNGLFGASNPAVGTTNATTRGVALADLDGDGDLDLIEANQNLPSRVYRYAGMFDSGTAFTAQSEATHAVAAGDLDEDGDLDIAAVFDTSTVDAVYFNEMNVAAPIINDVWPVPPTVNVDAGASTTINCDVFDDAVTNQDDLRTTFLVNSQITQEKTLLCELARLPADCTGLGVSNFLVALNANGQGAHLISVDWTPLVGTELGEYDLSCEVHNVVTGLSALSDLSANAGELTLVDQSGCTAFDITCDGIDDDCDTEIDEDWVDQVITCGVGACERDGLRTCPAAGMPLDTCTAGWPAADDSNCDGIDDDCNGTADDGFVDYPTTCGVGACSGTGTMACINNRPDDSCVAGTPAADDTDCDGIDDDCNGMADDGYLDVDTSCGVGECASVGWLSCSGGMEHNSCQPLTTSVLDDTSCNNRDDDCDNATDEDATQDGLCNGVAPMACQVARCVDGSCQFDPVSDCCTESSQCPSSSCSNGVCVAGTCTQEAIPGCCTVTSHCDDSNPCTRELCDTSDGTCRYEDVPDCCATDGDCDDGDTCTLDVCAGSNRCLQQASCNQPNPCGDDTSCWYSALWVDPGETTLTDVSLTDATEQPVLQLRFTTDAIGGELSSLKLSTDIVPPSGSDLRLALYTDDDLDGAVAPDAVPLAVADINGDEIVFTGITLGINVATTETVLITAQRVDNLAWMPAGGAVRWAGLLSLLLLGLLWVSPRQRVRAGMAVLLLIGFASCTFSTKVVPEPPSLGHLRLVSAEQVGFVTAPEEAVQIEVALIESVEIELPR